MRRLMIGGSCDGGYGESCNDLELLQVAMCYDYPVFIEGGIDLRETIQIETYRRESIRGEYSTFIFYVARGMSMDAAIERLLKNYRPEGSKT